MWHKNYTGIMKRIKGIAKAALALTMSLALPLTAIPASAAENEFPDLERTGSISITYKYYDENTKKTVPVTGENAVGIFKVADVVIDNGYKFVVDERFAEVGEIPSTSEELDASNLDLAEKMEKIAKSLEYDYGPQELSSEGKVDFKGLEVGLYLVMQAAQGKADDNKYVITPFLISIPYRNADGSLIYDVTADAKPLGIAKEEVPPPPKPPVIPQTGQLWWPVMALGVAGALLLTFGFIRRMKHGK